MPEEIIPQPITEEPKGLEADMDRLAGEILKHKENPELQGAGDREIVRQALLSISNTQTPAPQSSAEPNASASPYLPAYAQSAPPATKLEIEYLVDLALREGIRKASDTARKSNPFIMDAFHDALTGKLYPELQRRKLVN
jgi:hypothetical protein